MSQPNRLGPDVPAEFKSPLIDRDRPLQFSLNGRRFEAYEGDTVLSALLANGISCVGLQSGHRIALDAESAPPIVIEGSEAQMPMALCPVFADAHFRTSISRKTTAPIKSLFARSHDSLELDLDRPKVPGGWVDADAHESIAFDIAVVGGGIAGMSAALAAAKGGASVALLEREPVLGGMAVFFGKIEGETAPEELAERLATEVANHPAITVFKRAQAFDLAKGEIRAVQVVTDTGEPIPRHLAIACSKTVLATGMDERLQIFPGNRLPGVMGAGFVWRMARQFHVWPGANFHLHTATNAGYRLAILGSEAGKAVHRASDPRSDPRTRFIEYCKAYGFRLGWGVRIGSAKPARSGLDVRLVNHEYGGVQDELVKADALIISSGWQPAIALWVLAGGGTRWDDKQGRLVPAGSVPSVVMAGSVAGFSGASACIESGKASIDELRDGQRRAIADPQIAEIYESRDGPLAVSNPASRDLPTAWLGPARRAAASEPRRSGIATFLLRQPAERVAQIGAVEVTDVAGAIAGGTLPPEEAAAYCGQWCIVPRAFKTGELPDEIVPPERDVPDYLVGRFGLSQSRWTLRTDSERAFEPGSLIFINTDDTQPASAIGVVLSSDETNCVALMARTEFGEGDIVYLRDGATSVSARLGRKL